MGAVDRLTLKLQEDGYRIRGTLGLAVLLAVIYGVQLAVAGNFKYGAAYRVVEEHLRPHTVAYLALSPIVHSNHSHIAWNLGLLLVGGAITERIVGWKRLLMFTYGAGVLSNVLPPLIGLGGYGVGISAANFGLWTFFGLFYMTEWYNDGAQNTPLSKWVVGHGVLGACGVFYAAVGVLQYTGTISPPPGAAKGGHLLGIVFGLLWFAYHKFGPEAEHLGIWPRA